MELEKYNNLKWTTCIKFKPYLFLILSLEIWGLNAQSPIVIEGLILDSMTSKPIPYAHIYLSKSSLGTVSNGYGHFAIKLLPSIRGRYLKISSIGYQTATLKIKNYGESVKILLSPSSISMEELTVTAQSALGIVKQAVAKIPDNYSTKPTQLQGFIRLHHAGDSIGAMYSYETLLQIYKPTYLPSTKKGHLKLLKGRKKELEAAKRSIIKFYGALHFPLRGDFINYRREFISQSYFKFYDYKLESITEYDGQKVYVISFKPKSLAEGQYRGKIYIELDSYAIIKAQYSLTPKGLKVRNSRFSLPNSPLFRWTFFENEVSFKKSNGTWHLQNIVSVGRGYDKSIPDSISSVSEYATTQIDTGEIDKIDYQERVQFTDISIDQIDTFDAKFWQNHNTIATSPEFQQLFKNKALDDRIRTTDFVSKASNESKNELNSKALKRYQTFQKILRIARRFSEDLSFFILPLQFQNMPTQLNYANNDFRVNSKIELNNPIMLMGMSFNIFYNFHSNWYLSYSDRFGFGKYKLSERGLGLSYDFNLSRKKRPFHIRPTLAFSYGDLKIDLDEFNNSQDITINGKTFDADRIQLALRQQNVMVQGRLRLAWELSRWWDLFGEVESYYPIYQKDGLHFREKSGFFLTRKSTTKSLGDEDIELVSSQERIDRLSTIQNFYFSLGFLFKFGF